jgi:hypothetical protein
MRAIKSLFLFAGMLLTSFVFAQDKEFTLEKTTLSQSEIKQKLSLPQVEKLKAHCAKLGYKEGAETEKSFYKGKDKEGDFQITFIIHTMKGAKSTMDLTYYEFVQGKTRKTYILAENDDTLYWADKVSSLVHAVSRNDNSFFACDDATRISCATSVLKAIKNCSACLKSIKSCITSNSRVGKTLLCILTQSTFACLPCAFDILSISSCVTACTPDE